MLYRCEGEIPEMKGNRVKLRRLSPRDAEEMFKCWSDPEVRRYSDLPDMPDPASAGEMIRILNNLSLTDDGLRWGIEEATGRLIGSCGMNWWQMEGSYRGEIGCELSRPYWGCGYMRESVGLVIDYAFEDMGLNRLEALTDPRNERAGRLFQALGFTLEGRLKEYRHTESGFVDANLHALLRHEWDTYGM
ncbi:GNAT family N-acetyltransferase [Paenibacillus sp.]|jgi:ribosomal-protein-alanine N-acetyltransferase|uniref:GNAT family N-acetyltransferase n=1 Tax=Paenibacillus sp. TaxID=58172 RepID=UPI0028390E77|nr:GNAT family N-acetyltransferase [Paenibacillus sp.]MDR0268547.1 GNAT family N-acetyltransferase [Paenibacillus sp.]